MADPQSEWLKVGGLIAVDLVYRFEELQEVYAEIIKRFGLNVPKMPHAKERKGKPDYKGLYDEDTKRRVAKLYADDISEWKYSFDNS